MSEELRCKVTTNPCGTDTWIVGSSCPCANCQAYLRIASLERELADARRERDDEHNKLLWAREDKKLAEGEVLRYREALRKVAIAPWNCDAIQYDGCEVCYCQWAHGEPELHAPGCLAALTEREEPTPHANPLPPNPPHEGALPEELR